MTQQKNYLSSIFVCLVFPFIVLSARISTDDFESLHLSRKISSHLKPLNASTAQPYSHPYIVSIQSKSLFWEHMCGGVLIAPDKILTSARCGIIDYIGVMSLRVLVGEHELSIVEGTEGEILNAQRHPNVTDVDDMYNDIDFAIINLKSNFTLNEYLQLVPRLADPTSDPSVDECLIATWALGDDLPGWPLQEAELTLVDRETCSEEFILHFNITENVYCTSMDGAGHNFGRFGDPLICHDEAGPYLAGILSWVPPFYWEFIDPEAKGIMANVGIGRD